jgi:hypothetical protein
MEPTIGRQFTLAEHTMAPVDLRPPHPQGTWSIPAGRVLKVVDFNENHVWFEGIEVQPDIPRCRLAIADWSRLARPA